MRSAIACSLDLTLEQSFSWHTRTGAAAGENGAEPGSDAGCATPLPPPRFCQPSRPGIGTGVSGSSV